jgi:hypothetical protein
VYSPLLVVAARFDSLPLLTLKSGLLCAMAKFALPTSDITMATMHMTFFIVVSYCLNERARSVAGGRVA